MQRREDLLRTFEQIGRLAVEQAVPLVLIAGDLFDVHDPEPALVAMVTGWLSRLAERNVRVAIIPGNHDSYWYERSVYRDHHFPSNTHVFCEAACTTPVTVQVNGAEVHLYGIAHDHTRERQPLPSLRRRSAEGIHIGLLHATVDPSPSFAVADRYLPVTSGELEATGLDFIALGHIHRFQIFNKPRAGYASQPGSPEPLALDETGPRGVNLVTIDDGGIHIDRLPIGVRTASRERIDCSGMKVGDVVGRLRQLADPNFILEAILVGTPDESVDAEQVQRELEGGFCYLSVIDRTDVVDSAFVRAIEHEQTIRGRFVRSLRERATAAQTDEERQVIDLALKRGLLALTRRSVQ